MRTADGVPPKPQSRTSHVIVSVPGHKAPLPLSGDQDQRHVCEPSGRIAISEDSRNLLWGLSQSDHHYGSDAQFPIDLLPYFP